MVCLFKYFKGSLPQIFLGTFFNTLPQICIYPRCYPARNHNCDRTGRSHVLKYLWNSLENTCHRVLYLVNILVRNCFCFIKNQNYSAKNPTNKPRVLYDETTWKRPWICVVRLFLKTQDHVKTVTKVTAVHSNARYKA